MDSISGGGFSTASASRGMRGDAAGSSDSPARGFSRGGFAGEGAATSWCGIGTAWRVGSAVVGRAEDAAGVGVSAGARRIAGDVLSRCPISGEAVCEGGLVANGTASFTSRGVGVSSVPDVGICVTSRRMGDTVLVVSVSILGAGAVGVGEGDGVVVGADCAIGSLGLTRGGVGCSVAVRVGMSGRAAACGSASRANFGGGGDISAMGVRWTEGGAASLPGCGCGLALAWGTDRIVAGDLGTEGGGESNGARGIFAGASLRCASVSFGADGLPVSSWAVSGRSSSTSRFCGGGNSSTRA